jgi:hypothetical protein
LQQRWQIELCDLPDTGIVYRGVTVDQDVSEANGFALIWDFGRKFRRMFGQLRDGFADDFELSFHSGTNHVVRLVTLQVVRLQKRHGAPASLLNVPKPSAWNTNHFLKRVCVAAGVRVGDFADGPASQDAIAKRVVDAQTVSPVCISSHSPRGVERRCAK